uniref:Uncharacterized protein n=1 Tax=Aegilops tauschii subsp. strangulata TaxID=200361 RepID=A0A453SQ72_AEGTS
MPPACPRWPARLHDQPSPQHLAQCIQRDAATSDTSVQSQIQNESTELGVAIQHLGAMLFELGRTMMALRMGPSPVCIFLLCHYHTSDSQGLSILIAFLFCRLMFL